MTERGIYQHTKTGKRYELVDVALHTETGEKMAVYRALYKTEDLGEEYGDHPLFVRPYDMFFDTVMVDGTSRPRFQKMDVSGELPLFITGNQHKAEYLSRLLDIPLQHQKLSLDEIQSTSLEEIVEHKVRQAYEAVKRPVLVEDTALCLTGLHGLPGPFIKFFLEAPDGLEALCRMADGIATRQAHTACVFGYYDGHEIKLFRGGMPGSIAESPRGSGGYGWDKIFCPDGYGGRTRAELNKEEDHATYVATKPIAKLRAFLQSRV